MIHPRIHPHGRRLLLCSVPALALVISCDRGAPEGDPEAPGRFVAQASSPEAFDLGMAADTFAVEGRGLPSAPDVTNCHTQGLALAGDDLVVSCVLYDEDAPAEQRTLGGKSYLLKAPLCDVVGCDGPPADAVRWAIEDITGVAPEGESQRITRMLLKKEELTPDELALRHLLTHPSGLVYDPDRDGVWVANSVYVSDSYAELLLIQLKDFGQGDLEAIVARRIPVNDHVGALSLIEGRYLVGASWGGRRWVIVDLESEHEPVSVDNPFLQTEHEIGTQDCDRWSANTILCGGNFRYPASPANPDVPLSPEELDDPDRDILNVWRGRLQLVRLDVARFPEVDVAAAGYFMSDVLPDRQPGIDIGLRMLYRHARGGQDELIVNDYDGYRVPLTLVSEGMAVDAARQHVYFIPADVPGGQLVRMTIEEP